MPACYCSKHEGDQVPKPFTLNRRPQALTLGTVCMQGSWHDGPVTHLDHVRAGAALAHPQGLHDSDSGGPAAGLSWRAFESMSALKCMSAARTLQLLRRKRVRRYTDMTKQMLESWFNGEAFPDESFYIVREGKLAEQYTSK